MRVLIVSEGKHEQGGALLNLVARSCPGFALEATHANLSDPRIKSSNGGSRGTMKRAIRWVQDAEARGFDACVLVLDEDGERSRVAEIDEAQASDLSALPRALGVAVRTFDAWMLADETAIAAALGRPIRRQKDPEPLKDPKDAFRALLGQDPGPSQSEAYEEVARRLRLFILEKRCPRGFAPFANRLRSLPDG